MYGLSRRELRFALLIGSAHFTQHAYYRLIPPLIPVLAVALSYPLWKLGLLISLYQLSSGIAQAPMGVLADRIDRRYLLSTGLALTGAAYVTFAAAPVFGAPIPAATVLGYTFEGAFLVMSLSMVIVGIGLAVVHPVGYPMITANVSEANKGKLLGIFGASSKLGDAAVPAAIAVLILALAWEQIILVFGVVGMLYGFALFFVLRGERYRTVPVGRRRDDDDGERGEDAPDDPPRDRRTFLYPMIAVYLYFISSMLTTRGLNSFLPAFLVAVYAYSGQIAGVAVGAESIANVFFALLLLSGAVTQLVLGGIADTHSPRRLIIYCMVLATVGTIALATLELHPILLFVVIVVLGTGLYGVNPPRDALISDLSPPEYEGRTFGYIFTAAMVTAAPLPTAIGYVLEAVGMREGFLLLAGGPILAGFCIALLYSDRVYVVDPDAGVEVSD